MYTNTINIDNEALRFLPVSECDMMRCYGRCVRDFEHVVCFWTGSGVEINVKASELWILVESDYNIHEPWISIKVNGALITRTMLPKGKYYIPIFRNMNPEEEKLVRIYKDVQAMSADDMHSFRIYGILTDGELAGLPSKDMKLEFIGDSITSGEGLRGAKKEWDWISMFFDSTLDYATLTAEALNADYNIVSQSGWGTYTGWDNDPHNVLPSYYDKVCGLAFGEKNHKLGAQEKFDFSKWQADVIVINLGTNDCGAFNSPAYIDPVTGKKTKQRKNEDGSYNQEDIEKFKGAVRLFLATLRYHNPNSKLLWAYGMLGNDLEPAIRSAIEEYTAECGDTNVYYQPLKNTEADETGSREHPGIKAHENAAAVLIPRIKELLGK